MITLKVNAHWLGQFFREKLLYEPIFIKQGLPHDAQFVAMRVDISDPSLILIDYASAAPDDVREAIICNVERKVNGVGFN